MPITTNDIKLLESERMTDTTDGGGRRTSRVVPDGVAGNVFPKVSRLDAVYGRVNLRKVYGAVQTADLDVYAGAHAIITDAPDNDKIHCTLFSTNSDFDLRTEARDRIESFVTVGPESRMILLGRQLPGQQSVLAWQRIEDPLPEVGDVLCLSTTAGSLVIDQQYFRVQSVDAETRIFSESNGSGFVDFKRVVVTLGTGVPLRVEFNGPDYVTQNTSVARNSTIRTTTVVDAARYFGIKPLSVDAKAGDVSLTLPSVYSALVPTTTRETALSNAEVGTAFSMAPAKAGLLVEYLNQTTGAGSFFYTNRPITRGSLAMTGCVDRADGRLTGSLTGTIDYAEGRINITAGSLYLGNISYQPAGVVTQTAHTIDSIVTIANRGTVYAFTANPLPAPGTVVADYRALGKWVRLTDDGSGKMTGTDPLYGIGSVDYATGAVSLTLGALPDVGSSVLLSWGSPIHYAIRAGATSNADTKMSQSLQLTALPISPSSLRLTYTAGGIEYTATDNGTGTISGNGLTGTVNYQLGVVSLNYTLRLPDSNTVVHCAYNQKVPSDPITFPTLTFSKSEAAAANVSLSPNIHPGSFNGTIPFGAFNVYVKDNGLGILVAPAGQRFDQLFEIGQNNSNKDYLITVDQVVGTINYIAGTLTLTSGVLFHFLNYGWHGTSLFWEDRVATLYLSSGIANYGWQAAESVINSSVLPQSTDISFITSPLSIDITKNIAEKIVPGSLLFNAGGKNYFDRNGTLFEGFVSATGSGTPAGQVDYRTGIVALSAWTNAGTIAITVLACLTSYGEYTADFVRFRTAGSPLRPGSFYCQATTENGQLISTQSSDSGILNAAEIQGTIDQVSGVARLNFGSLITAAGHESEIWFKPENVDANGKIWRPTKIIPSTLRYNAVLIANLPLNADILGLDPIRLPVDGQVPIYRPADVGVLHHTLKTALPNPIAVGTSYTLPRGDLSECWLADKNGKKLNPDHYGVDLVLGKVQMTSPMNLTGFEEPLHAVHRIEQMLLLSDIQINGQIAFSPALTRDFPAHTAFLSGAMLFGDLAARVTHLHDLLSFSAWSDTPSTGANAQYNDIDYPIEVLNNGALNERWRINFTSTTTFQVIGENLGVIATGTTADDCSPANNLTSKPYFVIRKEGFGIGWSAGNQLRFNTVGATAPIWCARTVLPGATLEGDSFSMQLRGDVDG